MASPEQKSFSLFSVVFHSVCHLVIWNEKLESFLSAFRAWRFYIFPTSQ
jgi:hypothetical protein